MNSHEQRKLSSQSPLDGILLKISKLGFPVAIQAALASVLALADVLMVSSFGKEATAAVGIASKWHFVALMILAGLAAASGNLVAQYCGKEDKQSAKSVALIAMRFGLAVIVPVTFMITLGSSWIMMLQTTDQLVIGLGQDYLHYAFPVLFFTHIVIVIEFSMRSSGDTLTPLLLSSITILVNIALNYWLINGGWGIEPMGVAGAALATTLSRLLQVILIVSYIKYRHHWLWTEKALQERAALRRSYRRLAIPATSGALLWAVGTLAYQVIFGHMGTTELAVYSMLGPFETMCYSIFFGISVSCSVLIGQSLGRDGFDDAQVLARYFLKLVLVSGIVIGSALIINRDIILDWLNLSTDELSPFAAPAVIILCSAIWIRMLNMVIINGILRAGGDHKYCLRIDFIAMWMTGVPLCAIAAFILDWPFAWVYALMLAEEVVRLVICLRRYRKKFWVKNLTITATA